MNTYAGDPVAGLVRMEYTGGTLHLFLGHAGRTYQGDLHMAGFQFAMVHPDDANLLEASGAWRRAPEEQGSKVIPDSYTRYRRKPGT